MPHRQRGRIMPGVTPINIIAQQAAIVGATKALSVLFPTIKVQVGEGVTTGNPFLPIGAVEFDAALSETHVGNAEVTKHPVEVGADISDHVRRQPEQLTINGIVSNTPLVFFASLQESPRRAEEAYGKLKELKDNGTVISVVTSLREYANMVITGFTVTRDAQNGQVLNCTLDLVEVLTAEVQTAEVPVPEEGVPNKSGASALGTQAAGPATAAQTTATGGGASVLSSLTGG